MPAWSDSSARTTLPCITISSNLHSPGIAITHTPQSSTWQSVQSRILLTVLCFIKISWRKVRFQHWTRITATPRALNHSYTTADNALFQVSYTSQLVRTVQSAPTQGLRLVSTDVTQDRARSLISKLAQKARCFEVEHISWAVIGLPFPRLLWMCPA